MVLPHRRARKYFCTEDRANVGTATEGATNNHASEKNFAARGTESICTTILTDVTITFRTGPL
jgi:hypothetical protein